MLSLRLKQAAIWMLALFLLPIIRLSLRVGGYRRTSRWLLRFSPSPHTDLERVYKKHVRGHMMGYEVNRMSQWGFIKATCLERSLLLWWLLRFNRIRSDVKIGVKFEADEMKAHAWVEYGGVVINDQPDINQQYKPYPDHASPEKAAAII